MSTGKYLTKRPWEIRKFTVNMEPGLGGDMIDTDATGHEVRVTTDGSGGPVAVGNNPTFTTTSVTFTLSGGSEGDYTIWVRVHTDGTPAQRLEAAIPLKILKSRS